MSIRGNIINLKNSLSPNIKLVAVSKTKSPGEIMEAYHAGHRIFGENKVQELVRKAEILPRDIKWHMIGHLQTNKVKYIAPFVDLIESVDSMRLLAAIDKEAARKNRVQDCLLQIHIAKEETKFGLSEEELQELLSSSEFKSFSSIRITGLMGMATFAPDKALIRQEFRSLANLFKTIKRDFFNNVDYFCEISMGMSSDYEIAIEEGSTIIRIGTTIFGERVNY